jgi:hypothetical protein
MADTSSFSALSIVDNLGQNHVDLRRIYGRNGDANMPEEATIKTPPTQEESPTSNPGQEERIERIADELAERAGNAEKRWDVGHDIFTK